MPRYFFDVLNDGRLQRDEIGRELPDLDAAEAEAAQAALEIACHQGNPKPRNLKLSVRDQDGASVLTLTLTLTITVERPDRPRLRSREIYRSSNGDRWLLVTDETRGLCVRHEANAPSGGHVTTLDLPAFLAAGHGPEKMLLLAMLERLLEGQQETAPVSDAADTPSG